MSNILPHSALAACNIDQRIRIYFQGYNGQLCETYTNDGSTFKRTAGDLPAPVKPKTFTPIACVCYDDLAEIRVYYLNIDYELQELCYTGGRWIAGELNDKKLVVASYTNLAVVHWASEFRIYYQRPNDNHIVEYGRSGTNAWAQTNVLREALPGSSLSAIRTADNIIRVYYQARDVSTHQLTTKNNWGDDTEIAAARTAPHTALSAVSIKDDSVAIRLYTQAPTENKWVEMLGDQSNAWGGPDPLGTAIPLSKLASVTWGSVSDIRVYHQSTGSDIVERKWRDGHGWSAGSKIPTA